MLVEAEPLSKKPYLPSNKYKVKLINPNGNREDTLQEIVSTLDALDSLSSSILASISSRIHLQHQQVLSLSSRLTAASDHVHSIVSGATKVTRIISPAKYPTDFVNPLKPLVASSLSPRSGDLAEEYPEFGKRTTIPSRFDPPIKHQDDLLACFHVRQPQGPSLAQETGEIGLGTPPTGLKGVDSFLLFNTADNPYEHYRIVGKTNLAPGGRAVSKKDEVQTQSPFATLGGTEPLAEVKEDFYYHPSTLQIPEINVPDQLPDLPGIVDSLDFTSIDNTPFFSFHQHQPNQPTQARPGPAVPLPPPSTTPVPPQVTPSPAVVPPKQVPTPSIPPPPPPPPVPLPVLPEPKKDVPKKSGGGDDMRCNLMAAIRAAGGADKASLRSAQERKYEGKKKRQEEKEKTQVQGDGDGSDLMADLKNTLAMRRKGISGIQLQQGSQGKQGQGGMGEIMQKLVTTIPTMDLSTDSAGLEDSESDHDDWD